MRSTGKAINFRFLRNCPFSMNWCEVKMKIEPGLIALLLLPVIALALGGCSFNVVDTEGLRLAYEDIDRASSKGVELKGLGEIPDDQRREAVDLYREAKASVNGYLQQTITDAADYEVNSPAASYTQTGSGEKVAAFVDQVDDLRSGKAAPKSAAVWIPIAVSVVTEIQKLNDQNQRAAYERFERTVKEHMMKSYEDL